MHVHVKDEVSVTNYLDRRAKKEKYRNGSHLKTVSQIDEKSNQHILWANMHIYTKIKLVSLSIVIYLLTANQRKVPKCLSFTSCKAE